MSIFEKARELGEMMLSSDESKAAADARAAFEDDEDAKAAMVEYVNYKNGVEKGVKEGALSGEVLDLACARLEQMLAQTREMPAIAELIKTETEFNFFVNQVLSIVKGVLYGEEEHGHCCDEDCEHEHCGENCGCGHCHNH